MKRAACLAFCLACTAAHAEVTPSTMMANVYRFSEAGAVLEICFASPAFKAAPRERVEALEALALRIRRLVKAIGQYYGDASLHPTYEATRSRIAAESRLRLHVKNHYEYCGERLVADLDAYLAENELLLGRYFTQPNAKSTQKRPPEPGPPRK